MAASSATAHAHTNRLAKEESPYLLQHQHNPVDWFPWGEEAFEKARKENKPIFLSVGYSTCHWCHVMERESFESEAIAQILNEHFVSIKVDREERTDVDRVYMTYVQATSGGGGWPMSVFLTPKLQPILGGTYFPPRDMYGRPGFATVLKRVAEVWKHSQAKVEAQTEDIMEQLRQHTKSKKARRSVSDEGAARRLDACSHLLSQRFDDRRGGFGRAPKFPRPAEINALLANHIRCSETDEEAADDGHSLEMALLTLDKMAAGGMHDHVGGGFHRYSVDEYFHIPHFEKMLYDTPQLANSYLAAFRVTGRPYYARIAADMLDYMLRDLRHSEGGFFSAEDADSLDPATGQKKEGLFYLWTEKEIDEALGPDKAPLFKKHYYVKAKGNADLSSQSDPHKEFGGLNCLIERHPISETAAAMGMSEGEAEKVLAGCRETLHGIRAKRPRPHLDDKVVTAWNGMAISALANAARALAPAPPPRSFPVEGRPPSDYLQAAQQAATFVKERMWDADSGRLRRSFRLNASDAGGYADDYAHLVEGLLDLYQADGNPQWLEWAYELQDTMDSLFWDQVGGGYFSTTGDDPSILLRVKEEYDGAEPAASSIAAANLFRLAAFSSTEHGTKYRDRGVATTSAFGELVDEMALAMPQMCCSLYLQSIGHPRQVVMSGKQGSPDSEALIEAAHSVPAPDKVIIFVDPSVEAHAEFWRRHNPEVWSMVERGASKAAPRAVAYVCHNFTCKAPTSDPAKVKELLREDHPSRPNSSTAPSAVPRLSEIDISSIITSSKS
eukprot:CAMPEP_0206140746 /NCGR_PEP_ID=MMETSP1473-20131121/10535_1 /ASSEMBLY_ACC=CAM_ASM_001109 /TAXON_ID=1461547 /ORGANISM="Stichococcus sp, Strain RCC1054" /LENGTH=783 /DNA_ID=CAMNT_0053535017 /DNA_START=195 /DNA_END=2546 /DNA_ORIENTATION=+